MNKSTVYPIITILATVMTITVNGLANALPLNGQGTGEISDRFAIIFVPAGYVFSIWGLIYLALIAYTIYQALPAQRDNPLLQKIAPVYWISSLANSVWIFLWHYEVFSLTLVAMVTILAALLYIYRQLSTTGTAQDQGMKWFVKLPFSIYLGWISVATVANASQLLFYLNWGGWGISPAAWAVIMLAVAATLGLLMEWREGDWLYVLVLVWAFVGIAVKQSDIALVANAAWAAAAGLALSIIGVPFLKRRTI
jgi:hypothetical protein